MSLKKVEQVKKDRGFKLFDLIIYGAVAALVVALFLGVFLTRDTSPLSGIRIYYDNTVIYEYVFEESEGGANGETLRADCVEDVKSEGDGVTLKISVEGGYNTVLINTAARTAEVIDADCSNRRDCVYSPALSDNSSFICCVPHKLKIEPLGYNPDDGTIIM